MELDFLAQNLGNVVANVASPGLWGSFVGFLSDILRGINTATGNYGLSIIIFTILMRGLLLPLDIKSRRSMKQVAEIQPMLKQINEKYKNDPDKRNKKTMELYQEHKVSPFGGCLPMLLQMPLLFAMFAALQRIASYELGIFLMEFLDQQSPAVSAALEQIRISVENSDAIRESMVNIIRQIFANPEARIVENLREAAGAENVAILIEAVKNTGHADVMEFLKSPAYDSFRFLWIRNIWVADSPLMAVSGAPTEGFFSPFRNGLFILPILSAVTAYYQGKLMPQMSGQAQQMKGMTAILPVMSLWFTATANAGFAVYWVINNLFQIVYLLIYTSINGEAQKGGDGIKGGAIHKIRKWILNLFNVLKKEG
jgi:YidC/Oxa1 family membrane protein insertase